ncbi:hypothetical protein [Lentibacter algarum]|uniref:hypothetical protein n=1 Tax=Lentibacter algarum TaxID=576131 RepID=UPI0026EB4204|nr:hypothetical protein [Lentibacter algarum]
MALVYYHEVEVVSGQLGALLVVGDVGRGQAEGHGVDLRHPPRYGRLLSDDEGPLGAEQLKRTQCRAGLACTHLALKQTQAPLLNDRRALVGGLYLVR